MPSALEVDVLQASALKTSWDCSSWSFLSLVAGTECGSVCNFIPTRLFGLKNLCNHCFASYHAPHLQLDQGNYLCITELCLSDV